MEFTNLTLQNKTSELDNITLNEYVDVNVLEKLINSTLLKTKFNNPFSKIHKTEKNQLIKYRNLIKDNEYAQVEYNRVKGMDCGRVNPKNSLGLYSIRRELRHTLAKHRYTDLDIDCCHQAILSQIIKKNNKIKKKNNEEPIKQECLKSYIRRRQDWFDKVIEHFKIDTDDPIKRKEIPKALFIRIMYGGGLKSWKKDFGIDENIKAFSELKQFTEEIKNIMQTITDLNPELKQKIIDRKEEQKTKDYNLNGSVCSYYLQQKECEILEQLYIHCRKKNLIQNDSCVLCADGLMIETEYYYPKLLDEFQDVIKTKFDITLNFSEKKMNQDYLEILDDSLDFKLYNELTTSGLIANYFKTIYSNEFMVVDDKLYKYTGVYWCADESKKSTLLHQFISTKFYKHMIKYSQGQKSIMIKNLDKVETEDDEAKIKAELQKLNQFEEKVNLFCNNVNTRNNLVEDIKHHISKTNIKLDDKPLLFVFNNKIYDLGKGQFIKPNPNDYLTVSCGYDYVDYYDDDKVIELNRIIDTIFTNPEVKNYYMQCLSTGLYGSRLENLIIATGAGGNGKSVLDSLMMKAVGSYGYKIPSSTLLAPIKDGGNPQIANLDNKRFVLAQEPDKSKPICSSTMKELTGDDTINSRKLYSGDCEIKLKLSLFMECNQLPKMDEVNDAIIRRVRVVPFTSKFVDANTYKALDEKEIKECNIFQGNTYYITEEFKTQYRQALLMILFKHFEDFKNNKFQLITQPQECISASTDYLSLSDDIFDWFTNVFEPTDDPSKILYFGDIFNEFTNSNYYQNMNKKDKRENNLKRFTTKLEKCVFLSKHIKKRDSTYNGIKHKKPYIIGYKLPDNDDNDVYDDNDD
jgi:P4 family phage/plasmid primase-like protien